MFTFMPHIMAKFTKYIVRTFLVENPDTGQKYSFCNSGGEGDYIPNLRLLLCPEVVKKYLWWVGAVGVESEFSVQLGPKLNNRQNWS